MTGKKFPENLGSMVCSNIHLETTKTEILFFLTLSLGRCLCLTGNFPLSDGSFPLQNSSYSQVKTGFLVSVCVLASALSRFFYLQCMKNFCVYMCIIIIPHLHSPLIRYSDGYMTLYLLIYPMIEINADTICLISSSSNAVTERVISSVA